MDWFVKAFLKASLGWLALGVSLGVAMAVQPPWVVYRPVHVHVLVLGFVAMMIFGVAYHVIPRFAGHPLHNARAAAVHWWLSNVGLLAMAAGFVLRPHLGPRATLLLAGGGAFAAAGAYVFVYLIWRTIDGRVMPVHPARRDRAVKTPGPRVVKLPIGEAPVMVVPRPRGNVRG
jgi:cbb3-type cytochrome oxidase subunit 1